MKEPLSAWVSANQPRREMYWRESALDQFEFFATLGQAVLEGDDEPSVISTHTSKSITLPVIEIQTPAGVVVTIRHNFYDHKVSVSAPVPVQVDFGDMFDRKETLHAVYFEGFPRHNYGATEGEHRVYGSHADDSTKFSVSLTRQDTLLFVTRVAEYVAANV